MEFLRAAAEERKTYMKLAIECLWNGLEMPQYDIETQTRTSSLIVEVLESRNLPYAIQKPQLPTSTPSSGDFDYELTSREAALENDDQNSLISKQSEMLADEFLKGLATASEERLIPIPDEINLPGAILLASRDVAVPIDEERELYHIYPRSEFRAQPVQLKEVMIMKEFEHCHPSYTFKVKDGFQLVPRSMADIRRRLSNPTKGRTHWMNYYSKRNVYGLNFIPGMPEEDYKQLKRRKRMFRGLDPDPVEIPVVRRIVLPERESSPDLLAPLRADSGFEGTMA